MAKTEPGKDVFGQPDAYAEDRPPGARSLDPLGRGMYNALKRLSGRKAGPPYGQGGIGSDATARPADDKGENGGRKKRSPLYDNPKSP